MAYEIAGNLDWSRSAGFFYYDFDRADVLPLEASQTLQGAHLRPQAVTWLAGQEKPLWGSAISAFNEWRKTSRGRSVRLPYASEWECPTAWRSMYVDGESGTVDHRTSRLDRPDLDSGEQAPLRHELPPRERERDEPVHPIGIGLFGDPELITPTEATARATDEQVRPSSDVDGQEVPPPRPADEEDLLAPEEPADEMAGASAAVRAIPRESPTHADLGKELIELQEAARSVRLPEPRTMRDSLRLAMQLLGLQNLWSYPAPWPAGRQVRRLRKIDLAPS